MWVPPRQFRPGLCSLCLNPYMWLGSEHKIEDLPWLQLVRKADYFWDREEELNNCSQERLWIFWFSKDRPGVDYGEKLGVCGTDIKCAANYNPFLVHRLPRLPLTRSSFVHEILHLITPNYILWKAGSKKCSGNNVDGKYLFFFCSS